MARRWSADAELCVCRLLVFGVLEEQAGLAGHVMQVRRLL